MAAVTLPQSLLSPVPPATRPPLHSISFSRFKSRPRKLLPFSTSTTTTSLARHQLSQPLIHPPAVSGDSIGHEYIHLLHLSVRYGDVELAKAVHASILKLEEDTHLSTALISSYFKLGRINAAEKVFRRLLFPNVVTYTAMISSFAKSNRGDDAIKLFFEMMNSGIQPNEYTFVAILTACVRISAFEFGFQIHGLATKIGCLNSTFVSNALMSLYGKSGFIEFMLELFDEMPQRDIASWNTVISVMVKESMFEKAFELFIEMLNIDRFRFDQLTVSTLLSASAGCSARSQGREIHAQAIKLGFETNLSVNNALILFYTKCGDLRHVDALFKAMAVKDVITWTEMITAYMEFGDTSSAQEVFDEMPAKNLITYNALLAGFSRNGDGVRALKLFCDMVEEGMEINEHTFTIVFTACGLVMERRTSEQMHGFFLKSGLESNEIIETALLDMCAKCGRTIDAEKIFASREKKDLLLMWTSIICGYIRDGQSREAICLFVRALNEEETMILDEFATAAVLRACGIAGLDVAGKQIHGLALKLGFLSDVGVGNSLIAMYSKCGNTGDSVSAFNSMPEHDLVSWNSLISGHVLHRNGDQALEAWQKMENSGISPDSSTCLFVISAYKHTKSNQIHHCRSFFRSMKPKHQIEPTIDHFREFIAILGYWGLLDEAEQTIAGMPFPPDSSIWHSLLHSSRFHPPTTTSPVWTRAVKNIISLQPNNPSTYTLKANLYAASGRWTCSDTVRFEMRDKGFIKKPGKSWVVIKNRVHEFYGRDKSHPETKDIYKGVEMLILECMKKGYVPDTRYVLQEVGEDQRRDFLFSHSAKLAVGYGLLRGEPGKPVRVMKNVVLCGDCHSFMKRVSVVVGGGREIWVRDSSGFHCFVDGECSCRDCW